MKENCVQPGSYPICMTMGTTGSQITLDTLIVHEDSFALLFHADPHAEFDECRIKKNREELSHHRISRAHISGSSFAMVYGKLPAVPFEIIIRNKDKRFLKWEFRLKSLLPGEDQSGILFRTITVNASFSIGNGIQIHISHISTGQFPDGESYALLKGDFSEVWGTERFLMVDMELETRVESYLFVPWQYLNAFEHPIFLPPEATISGCRLVSIPELIESSQHEPRFEGPDKSTIRVSMQKKRWLW
ncbi:MAG: hypothetical protein RDV48_29910 [Candidatus Eremiobacteraeota bacterium]|nr:hypothetical protein [Candidatus Eremiobacteraeota bacterium]